MRYKYYASDILESAMELAQSKALNSYSFRDCMNWLTALWQRCYERICQIDEGYYSKTVLLTKALTKLPAYVQNTVTVYTARDIDDGNRQVFREASFNDLMTSGLYRISGLDLFCPDAERRKVFLNYIPEPPFISYTMHNREPRILEEAEYTPGSDRYGTFRLKDKYVLQSMYDKDIVIDISDYINRDNKNVVSFIMDFPYIFVSYQDTVTNDYSSYILKDMTTTPSVIRYNPFDYQGRPSRVRYLRAKWNDYTGMGVVIKDQDDDKIKELGWTPDTLMNYPSPIIRNYLVAMMAKKFADLNGASIIAVDNEVADAAAQLSNWLDRNKSAWVRPTRTTGWSLGDWL